VGKSEVALELAQRLGGEIISVDSMQVYRGMNIGTAKPTAEQRSRVPHHLIDVVDIAHPFDAAQFVTLANRAIKEIQSRGRVVILCGGTGLYFRALFDGLGPSPAGSPELRQQLEGAPLAELLRELAEQDPATYARIDRNNPRRVVRAIEVIRLTGRPYSAQRADWSKSGDSQGQPRIFGLTRDPGELHSRIATRVDLMFAQGLVDETEALLKSGLASNRTALQALGYRQVVDYLKGVRSLAETIELVKIRTRQFAKRQMTWFRRQPAIDWLHIAAGQTAEQVASKILSRREAATRNSGA
jgi:tRNA dimethylallyltransferase